MKILLKSLWLVAAGICIYKAYEAAGVSDWEKGQFYLLLIVVAFLGLIFDEVKKS